MHPQTELNSQPDARPRPHGLAPTKNRVRDRKERPKLSTEELAFRTVAAFRAHPHISNVLTHISCADWVRIERSLAFILDPATTSGTLSPLEQNIIDLMCADRGTSGRILKPYFHALIYSLLEARHAEWIILQVERLFREVEWKAQQPEPARSVPTAEDVRNESR
jgi:hypothetical protein